MNAHKEHTMKCPSCIDTALVMSDRQGVEIDYCPQCRSVWLDRGELDKLIERSAPMVPTPARDGAARSHPEFADSDYDHGRGAQGSRKKSWLSNIFD
jgi:Zn-finger nucleic acid-binding protein